MLNMKTLAVLVSADTEAQAEPKYMWRIYKKTTKLTTQLISCNWHQPIEFHVYSYQEKTTIVIHNETANALALTNST